MEISDKHTQPVCAVDINARPDDSFTRADTIKTGAVILKSDTAEPIDNVMGFTYSQVEATMFRIAQISIGISWSSYISKYEAGILASHTLSAFLVHLHVPNIDKTRDLVKRAVFEGLDHFYTRSGVIRDKPRGTLEVQFKHPESPNNVVNIKRKA